MSDETVTPIRRKATPKAPTPTLLLTELPEETVHRVACILTYLSNHPRANDAAAKPDDDERFGEFILLRDLAAALDWAREVAHV
jgi:hypothetical protein